MICLMVFGISLTSRAEGACTAFFYGKPVPVDILSKFEQVVIEPENIGDISPLVQSGTQVFAYVSVSEINSTRPWLAEIPDDWVLGKNGAWGSIIVDVSLKAWQNYLVEKQLKPLWERGYRGFFLDTLDSYQLVIEDPDKRSVQQQALADLIRAIHDRFPGIKLMLNRGFDLLPKASDYISAVAAESLFQGWDPKSNGYKPVVEQDREWLLNKLKQVREQYGVQVIVLDYVSPKERDLAREAAKQIGGLGFTPWVSNISMDMIGIGCKEVSPKRFLVLYDDPKQLETLLNSFKYKFLMRLLEYLGYRFEYKDIRKGLPGYCLAGQYTKIVSLPDEERGLSADYKAWLDRQIDNGLEVVDWEDWFVQKAAAMWGRQQRR